MGKSLLPRTWRPLARRQQQPPAPRSAGPGRGVAGAAAAGRAEAGVAAARGDRCRAQGAGAGGRRQHGVPGAAAAPAGRVGRAHRRLVPRPRAEQVHQQLSPLPVAVPATAALGSAPGESRLEEEAGAGEGAQTTEGLPWKGGRKGFKDRGCWGPRGSVTGKEVGRISGAPDSLRIDLLSQGESDYALGWRMLNCPVGVQARPCSCIVCGLCLV